MQQIGKYKITAELGRGGMGIVYKAFDPLMEREVAIKVLSPHAFSNEEIKERFYREARSLGQLSHENITIVHDLGKHDGTPFIVMEYLGGTDLRTVIKQQTTLTFRNKIDICRQICAGLSYSHSKQIVHRDIKPENIRILEGLRVKIMDFGIARQLASTMTATGTTMGTPYYMSPEQVRGKGVGPASDIFAFGVILYELIEGEVPFAGEEPTTVMYKIVHEPPRPFQATFEGDTKIRSIILKCLEKQIEERYQSFDAVLQDLEEYLELPSSTRVQRAEQPTVVIPSKKESTSRLPKAPKIPKQPQAVPPTPKENFLRSRLLLIPAIALLLLAAVFLFWPSGDDAGPGYLAVDVRPSATIIRILTASGEPLAIPESGYTTPLRLTLPAGEYRLICQNPGHSEPMDFSVKVREGASNHIVKNFPGFDPQKVAERFIATELDWARNE